MLIFCCGMMRSGSTVQYQIATELIESQNLGMSIGWVSQFNAAAAKILEDAARRDDKIVVIKTHHYTAEAAGFHQRGLAKMIYSYRDLRDVVVSLGHQFYPSPDDVLSGSTVSRLLRNDYSWRQLPEILVSRYEDIVNQLPEEVLKIADYLNVSLTVPQAVSIADKFSLANQHRRMSQPQSAATPSGAKIYDPVNQLHSGHIQSAATGRWQKALSTAQINDLESATLSWLVDRSYLTAALPQNRATDETAAADIALEGDRLRHQSRWLASAQAYQSAIRLGSTAPQVHHALGQVYFHQGRFSAAVNAYQHANALAPDKITYICDLGDAWCKIGEYNLAAIVYQQAIAIQPQAQLPQDRLAKVLAGQGSKLKNQPTS